MRRCNSFSGRKQFHLSVISNAGLVWAVVFLWDEDVKPLPRLFIGKLVLMIGGEYQ